MNCRTDRALTVGRACLLALASAAFTFCQPIHAGAAENASAARACDPDNGGINLSPGFCASVFADKIGHVRHMVVGPDGTLYVNTWSGRYFGNDKSPAGGFIVVLKDSKGDGKADVIQRFGEPSESGAAGGSGIALYKGALYVEEKDRILRYTLSGGLPSGQPDVVLSDMPLTGDHPMHPFVIDATGNLYVDIGSATNACQAKNRTKGSPGLTPCTELETRAGTWRYDANKTGQHFSPAERFATGIRNGEGFAFDAEGHLYVTQHGRDQLAQNWPALFTVEQSAELPAEEVVRLERGGDYGWPFCYYDKMQKKLVLAPEYGGDGKIVGLCANKKPPVAAFPGHWAPNDMLIYNGTQFPAPYRGGMFIAFHGSWNRAPLPQAGYDVVYQPMAHGRASGDYIVFADGFTGGGKDGGSAAYRPTGLAVAPDGALYISDDKKGRIWRVVFAGNAATTKVASAVPGEQVSSSGPAVPPEGMHPDAGRQDTANLPVPAGSSHQQVADGDQLFHGEVKNGTCSGCHGGDAKGTNVGPDLTSGKWLWGDGSLQSIKHTIIAGVPKPKNYPNPMPAHGGAQLSQADISALAAYVWAVSHADGNEHAKTTP